MHIRDARAEDFPACLPLFWQLWPALKPRGDQDRTIVDGMRTVFCDLLEDSNARILLAEEDGAVGVVGLLDLTFRRTLFHRGWAMIIEDLIVNETHRREGIARQLVEYAEQVARERGCRAIELSSDLHRQGTHQFWEALGYDPCAYQFRKELIRQTGAD
ncbi:MAG: GNAT family N-acetyltransferase [Phycisphaerales bacterium]|nr:MAG: GNAT family N-acetyltransferase [Phycisphaerales bacterium]